MRSPFDPISAHISRDELLSGSARPHNRTQTSRHSQTKTKREMVKTIAENEVLPELQVALQALQGRLLTPFQPISPVMSSFRVATP